MEVEEYLRGSHLYRLSEAGSTDSSSSATPLVTSKRGSFGTARGVASTWSAGSWIAGRRYKLVDLDEQVVERYLLQRGREAVYPTRGPGRAQAMAVSAARGRRDRAVGA